MYKFTTAFPASFETIKLEPLPAYELFIIRIRFPAREKNVFGVLAEAQRDAH